MVMLKPHGFGISVLKKYQSSAGNASLFVEESRTRSSQPRRMARRCHAEYVPDYSAINLLDDEYLVGQIPYHSRITGNDEIVPVALGIMASRCESQYNAVLSIY
jgi:hypothetical protein